MPYLEILAPPEPPDARRILAQTLTDGLCDAFAVGPDTVTIYFVDIAPAAFAHAGRLGSATPRIFVKLHAYARDIAARRHAAKVLTERLVAAYGVPAAAIALYFFDRSPDEVAHGGRLSCDAAPP